MIETNKEILIKKWLDNDLSPRELEAFKALDDYDSLIKLSDSIKKFESPDYNVSEEYNEISKQISTKKADLNTSKNWIKPFIRIAALLAISFSVYYYSTNLDTTINALASEKVEIILPDNSEATLNALTTLTYNKNDWSNNREVILNGEAYFKVAKGSTFDVITNTGTVTVLGTQFKVKQYGNLFEVVCYEGSVGVTYNAKQTKLKPGESFLIIDGKYIAKEKENISKPFWLNNESHFKSMPYKYVLNEFERQYNVKINSKNINTDSLFTGSFVHGNKDLAIKAITLPLNINYLLQDSLIVLNRE